ncbi:ATP-grasp domain-containing protein [Fictibacillus enclensis]|uniref:ATP-grasp domain-containing protein n=1 Tax=Fictibacillus enclensis TaxID=1017270 RepID=UPI0024C0D7C9|nr:ATP-grasp domain-containing protein [Fictibacillus enclensis]MDM5337017.1 ATP-grasp domain-containing protein [Fictibacillus enclensis]WHY73457.1 ATP-grasp domain-containing protein [Fictibacillus enclensis]
MQKSKPIIVPRYTFSEIYGPDLIFNPRPSFAHNKWIPDCPVKLDLLTGSQFAVMGDMPVICSRSVTTRQATDLYERAGLQLRFPMHYYSTEEDYRNLFKRLEDERKRMVVQHIHPEEEMSALNYWIDPKLVQYLNNKANLEELVPEGHAPKRVSTTAAKLHEHLEAFSFPCVVKAATNEANAAGFDVFICRTDEDIQKAEKFFETCEGIVIEEYLEIEHNYCVQFACTFDEKLIYLGSTVQNIDENAKYKGNWVDEDSEPDSEVIKIGRRIMEEGCKRGYRGIAGFDIAVTPDGRKIAFDLNYRVNGSTAALLLKDSITEQLGKRVVKYVSWKSSGGIEPLYDTVKQAIEDGYFVPLSIYNGSESPYEDADTLIQGLVLGDSRYEADQKEHIFERAGLS